MCPSDKSKLFEDNFTKTRFDHIGKTTNGHTRSHTEKYSDDYTLPIVASRSLDIAMPNTMCHGITMIIMFSTYRYEYIYYLYYGYALAINILGK